jgi:hypothetical protein
MDRYTLDEAVARGLIQGAEPFSGFGERTTAGAETNFVVWPNGAFSIPAKGGVQMSIVSTSADDAAAGTGVRSVEVHYLDGRFEPQIEIVTLNGVTPVTTTATDISFIQCMHIDDVGSGLKAAGNISATHGGVTYSYIQTGAVRCSSSARMVPRGKRLFITGAVGSSISGTAVARTQMYLTASTIGAHQFIYPLILFPFAAIGVQDNAINAQFSVIPPLPAGTVVAITHTSDKAATISATWFGRLEGE